MSTDIWSMFAKNADPAEVYYPPIGLFEQIKLALGYGDPTFGTRYREAVWIEKQLRASFAACRINTPGDKSKLPGVDTFIPADEGADPAYNYRIKPPAGVRAQRLNVAFLDDFRSRLGGLSPELTINQDGIFIRVPLDRTPPKPPRCTLADLGAPPESCRLPLPLGGAQHGPYWADLAGAPHLLVAGATGSGKSTLLHACLHFLLDRAEVWGIDMKRVELGRYRTRMARLAIEPEEVNPLLAALFQETRRRLEAMEQRGANAWSGRRIVLVVDELAEVTLAAKGDTALLLRLAQLGRAAGVHLVLATQRPSVQIIPGDLKANVPLRVCLALPTGVDSRVVLDREGAELLDPPGDAYVLDGHRVIRVSTPNYTAPAVPLDLTTAEDPRLLGLNADERAAWKAIQEAGCRATERAMMAYLHWGSSRTRRALRALRASGMLATDATKDATRATDATDATAPTEKVFMEPSADTPVAVASFCA